MNVKLKDTLRLYKNKFFPPKAPCYYHCSYSQEGEDLILARFLAKEPGYSGYYVDVGAHHPQRFSNTYYFYLQGWRGINIDAMPESMALFNQLRPNDINLELAISDTKQTLIYYIFDEPALNSFDREISLERTQNSTYKIIDQKLIKTITLAEVLDRYLANGQEIDFLNIDVEGLDYQVLRSNNWSKYRPSYILAENYTRSLQESHQSLMATLLSEKGYELVAKTMYTLIFQRKGC